MPVLTILLQLDGPSQTTLFESLLSSRRDKKMEWNVRVFMALRSVIALATTQYGSLSSLTSVLQVPTVRHETKQH